MTAELAAPSPFLLAQLTRLAAVSGLGPVADLACGRGRHALACAERGLRVLALDRNRQSLDDLGARAHAASAGWVQPIRCDLEGPPFLPIRSGTCSGILVFRFLFRALAPEIGRALAPGGWLVFETFTTAQRQLGTGPRSAAFLLEPGELPGLFPDLEIVSHEEGIFGDERPLALARLLARKPGAGPEAAG